VRDVYCIFKSIKHFFCVIIGVVTRITTAWITSPWLANLAGYTFGMKTAVSIPDDVFEDAERLASRLQTSRSQLYARALSEFVARHDDDQVTSAMNQVVEDVGEDIDDFTRVAGLQTLWRVKW